MIRAAEITDAAAIADIYNFYVDNTTITFEEQRVSTEEMTQRIRDVRSAFPWMVIETSSGIAGYAYATKWRARSAYRFSVETSVYLRNGAAGQGLGRQLYEALFEALVSQGIHVAIGGIALPNEASVRLHETMGMKKIAHFEQVGFKFGKWLDVGYWQRVL